jgi:hypothetical protein
MIVAQEMNELRPSRGLRRLICLPGRPRDRWNRTLQVDAGLSPYQVWSRTALCDLSTRQSSLQSAHELSLSPRRKAKSELAEMLPLSALRLFNGKV